MPPVPEGPRFDSRMSDVDALTMGIERDPALRATITIVSILDRPADRDRLVERLEQGSRLALRLRQRAVSAPFVPSPPRWVTQPAIDFGYHLRRVRAPGQGTMRDVLDVAAPFAMQVFDRARPLWEMTLVEGLADGRAALVQKHHHATTDGVGFVELAGLLVDLERDPPPREDLDREAPPAEAPSTLGLLREALVHERRWRQDLTRRGLGAFARAVRSPTGAVRAAGNTAASMARVLSPPYSAMSPVMRGRSWGVRFDSLEAPIDELKAAARRADAKLNDAFTAAVAGGLRRYHVDHGAPVDALRMAMPISTRGEDDGLAGNQFVPARFALPMTVDDPLERMAVIRRLVAAQRVEPALALTTTLAGVVNRLPGAAVTTVFGAIQRGVDFLISNVPGVPVPMFLGGAKIEANYAFGPLTGAAANVTLVSYVGDVHVGVNTDPAAVPDPEHFCDCLQTGFDEIRKLA
jgi:diacylglycerol O-acyltransferase / wax synthase